MNKKIYEFLFLILHLRKIITIIQITRLSQMILLCN